MTVIDRGDLADAEPLGGGDDSCVDGAERKVAIDGDEFGDPQPVACRYRLDRERT
jgi:hypothetical protein